MYAYEDLGHCTESYYSGISKWYRLYPAQMLGYLLHAKVNIENNFSDEKVLRSLLS
jgi:hypothetical protein